MPDRKIFIAGNWKMNPASAEAARALADAVNQGVGTNGTVEVAVGCPSVFLSAISDALEDSLVGIAAQNMHWAKDGAYTGELSAAMLLDVGCTHVILGHSERRHGLGETDEFINKKLHAALEAGLYPILCLGETLAEREANQTETVVRTQLDGSLAGLSAEQMNKVVLAYEPVWAIGTGRTASPQQAQDVHAFIRKYLADKFGQLTASIVRIQYGGSVKADNAEELLACPDIDGALVGGASLKAADFMAIIEAGRKVSA